MNTRIMLLASLFFFATTTTHAQINEGRYLLGGSFSFYNSSTDNGSTLNTNLQVGKMIKENTVVGLLGSIASSTRSISPKFSIHQYSAGAFYRKYKPLKNNFYFFGELYGSFQHQRNLQTYFPNINQTLFTKSNGVSVGFIPGISYSVWKKMQIEATMPNLLGISYQKIKTVDSSLPPTISSQEENRFSLYANVNSNLINNFGIGFKFLLGK